MDFQRLLKTVSKFNFSSDGAGMRGMGVVRGRDEPYDIGSVDGETTLGASNMRCHRDGRSGCYNATKA